MLEYDKYTENDIGTKKAISSVVPSPQNFTKPLVVQRGSSGVQIGKVVFRSSHMFKGTR